MGELLPHLSMEVSRDDEDDHGTLLVEYEGDVRQIRYLPNFLLFMDGYFRHESGLPPYVGHLGAYQQTVERYADRGLAEVMRRYAEMYPERYEEWIEIYYQYEEELSTGKTAVHEEQVRRAVLSSDMVGELKKLAQDYPEIDPKIFEQ